MRVRKADLGLWEHQRSRGKAYGKVWCQGAETPEEKEGHPGGDCKAEQMEAGKGRPPPDQVELRRRRLLVHTDIQEGIQATLEADPEGYVKVHPEAPG